MVIDLFCPTTHQSEHQSERLSLYRDVYYQSNFPVDGVDDGELDERGEDEEGAAEEPVVQHLDVAHLREIKPSYFKMIRS